MFEISLVKALLQILQTISQNISIFIFIFLNYNFLLTNFSIKLINSNSHLIALYISFIFGVPEAKITFIFNNSEIFKATSTQEYLGFLSE